MTGTIPLRERSRHRPFPLRGLAEPRPEGVHESSHLAPHLIDAPEQSSATAGTIFGELGGVAEREVHLHFRILPGLPNVVPGDFCAVLIGANAMTVSDELAVVKRGIAMEGPLSSATILPSLSRTTVARVLC